MVRTLAGVIARLPILACAGLLLSGLPQATAAPQDVDVPVESAALQLIKEIPLSTDIAGTLEFVDPTEEGQVVQAGQEVIRLQDDVIRAELESAQRKAEFTTDIDFAVVALEKAKIDLQVQQEQNAANPQFPPFTEAELRQSRLEVQKAEAQLQKANDDMEVLRLEAKTKEAQLKQYSVSSPIDGVVTNVNRYPGQAVRQGDAILTVTDVTTLRAVMKVSSAYRDQVAVGQEVVITFAGPSLDSSRSENSAAVGSGSPQGSSSRQGGGLLSGAPGLRNASPSPRPAAPRDATPSASAAAPPPANAGEQFTGRVTFIAPRVDPTTQVLEVYARVPNRKVGDRWLLSGGMNISAVIKAKP